MKRPPRQKNPEAAPPERLQKIMAAAGLGSRRNLEQRIRDGDVLVNGKVATVGQSVREGDTLTFAEQRWTVISHPAQHRTLVYNKPEGEVVSRHDPEGRPTVFQRLPRLRSGRWIEPDRHDEVIISEPLAEAHALDAGGRADPADPYGSEMDGQCCC